MRAPRSRFFLGQKMNSTVTQSTTSTDISSTMTMTSVTQTSQDMTDKAYHTVLMVIYSVVLLSGTISLSLMVHIMKSSTSSTTSIAVLNLIFAHFVFLVTVPFRIYYYAAGYWDLGHGWCKMVSSMIHIHMYMSFIFYVIILITRLLTFYNKADRMVSFQRIHALLLSALVWIVVLVMVPCVIHFSYGQKAEGKENNTTGHCFKFGESINSVTAKVFNYIVSTLIILVAAVLTALQANVLWVLYRKHRQGCTSQQEFGAQQKSLCFALIMVVCFVPYHLFRFYYLEDLSWQNINEVFLSFTTFNCLDMLTFMGRRTCNVCFLGRAL